LRASTERASRDAVRVNAARRHADKRVTGLDLRAVAHGGRGTMPSAYAPRAEPRCLLVAAQHSGIDAVFRHGSRSGMARAIAPAAGDLTNTSAVAAARRRCSRASQRLWRPRQGGRSAHCDKVRADRCSYCQDRLRDQELEPRHRLVSADAAVPTRITPRNDRFASSVPEPKPRSGDIEQKKRERATILVATRARVSLIASDLHGRGLAEDSAQSRSSVFATVLLGGRNTLAALAVVEFGAVLHRGRSS